MTQDTELDFHKGAKSFELAYKARRAKIIGPLMAGMVAAIVVLAMIAESRLTFEQRLELFESSHSYP
jgi:4-hydroxybenzoate polyprenyltransferase